MCKKLIICACFVLVMVAMTMPVSAGYVGMKHDDRIIHKIDINANGYGTAADTQAGWDGWTMPSYWGSYGPTQKNFGLGTEYLGVFARLNGYKDGVGGSFGGSRKRSSAPDNTNDFGEVYQDLAYVAMGSSGGLGMDYIELWLNFGPSQANRKLEFTMFCYDSAFLYAGEPNESKWAAWSTTNPRDWLTNNWAGIEPNGYRPAPGIRPDSNMPCYTGAGKAVGLAGNVIPENAEGGRALMMGPQTWDSEYDTAYGMKYTTSFEATLDENGQITLYGWADMTDWTGSQHVALNGFAISVPEPATVALLGLGGLALMRRRRR